MHSSPGGFLWWMARGQWQTLQTATGWHIVRLDGIEPGRPVTLDEVIDQVAYDAKQERIRTSAVATIREMSKSYVVRRSDVP